MKRIFLITSLIISLFSLLTFAHSGRTDAKGGHRDSSTGTYHYHHGYGPHDHPEGVCPYSSISTKSSSSSLVVTSNPATATSAQSSQTPSYSDGYNKGYDDGYDVAYTDGYADGLNTISDETYDEIYSEGHDDGYEMGHEEGKEEGYREGYEDCVREKKKQSESTSLFVTAGLGIFAIIGYIIYKRS